MIIFFKIRLTLISRRRDSTQGMSVWKVLIISSLPHSANSICCNGPGICTQIDGTFRVVNKPFMQLLGVHVFVQQEQSNKAGAFGFDGHVKAPETGLCCCKCHVFFMIYQRVTTYILYSSKQNHKILTKQKRSDTFDLQKNGRILKLKLFFMH